MNPSPLVSVVVTAYNQAPYIGPALESVFARTYKPYEVVVVDDGSTDDTPERIAPYRHRIVYVRQPNRGVAQSRNIGVERARGALVAFLDGDDLWEPNKLVVQVAAANAHPASGLIAVDGLQFGPAGITRPFLIPAPIAKLFDGRTETLAIDAYHYFQSANVISTMSQAMVPATVLRSVGPSDQKLALVSDWDLYLRISQHYPVTFVNRRLTRWRHESSASGHVAIRGLRWSEDGVRMFAKHARHAPHGRRLRLRAAHKSQVFTAAQEAYYCVKEGQRELGRKCLWRLLRWTHVSLAPPIFLLATYAPAWLTRALGRAARTVLRLRRTA